VKALIQRIFRRDIIKRFIKFGIVGAISFFVDAIILSIQFKLVGADWFRRLLAPVVSFEFGVTNNYMLYHHWVWKDRRKETRKEYWLGFFHYNLTAGMGLLLRLIVMNLLIEMNVLISSGLVHFIYKFQSFFSLKELHFMVANLIAVLLAAVFNFIIVHKIIFKNDPVDITTNPDNPE